MREARNSAVFTVDEVREIYARTARRYDRAVRLFPLLGARMDRYRRAAVDALGLRHGSTVLDLGCGTGLNFPLLQERVGPAGRIIGVDLTEEMLEGARKRTERLGWSNVELVRSDVAEYDVPEGVDAVLSTFALTLSPAFDQVIADVARALPQRGRLVILDLKRPDGWPAPLVRFAAWLNRPFAVTLDLGERRPWESVATHLALVDFREYYAGAIYLSVGEPRPRP